MIRSALRPRTVEERFASITMMEGAARRRIPRFIHDYMVGGIGREVAVARGRDTLDAVQLMPRYLEGGSIPDLSTMLLGQQLGAPFGAAPVGLAGLIWPEAEHHIASAAVAQGLPVGLSSYATATIEEIGAVAGRLMWFQLYPLRDESIEQDLLARFAAIGGEVLIITVDIPGRTRRERDIANGLSVPPRPGLRVFAQCAARPAWSLATLRAGVPHFRTLARYRSEAGDSLAGLSYDDLAAPLSPARLRRYRDLWKGRLVIKGILSPRDAEIAADCGADGIVVSNHGGRQLDAAPSALDMLPEIRRAIGTRIAVLADGGARSGLDITRMLAKGADFVLLGRVMALAVAAMGREGPAHALHVLTDELRCTLVQLGCSDHRQLPEFLYEPDA